MELVAYGQACGGYGAEGEDGCQGDPGDGLFGGHFGTIWHALKLPGILSSWRECNPGMGAGQDW